MKGVEKNPSTLQGGLKKGRYHGREGMILEERYFVSGRGVRHYF